MQRFSCDEMLRGLGRWLCPAGYDTIIAACGLSDRVLAARCADEHRVLLTKDRHPAATAARTARVVLLHEDGVAEFALALGGALGIDWQHATFTRCVGWMAGRPSVNTRRLHLDLGGFLYDRDALNDELPYWVTVGTARHLVIPYSFETNDNRFDQNLGFSTGEDFARYMIDCFEVMYEEGVEHPKLMSLALHDRLTGRPGRITGLIKFLDHVTARDRVWICTARDIAEHWRKVHPG